MSFVNYGKAYSLKLILTLLVILTVAFQSTISRNIYYSYTHENYLFSAFVLKPFITPLLNTLFKPTWTIMNHMQRVMRQWLRQHLLPRELYKQYTVKQVATHIAIITIIVCRKTKLVEKSCPLNTKTVSLCIISDCIDELNIFLIIIIN